MALRALMLRKKIDGRKKELEELRGKDAGFEQREAELSTAIDEVESSEETAAVEEEVARFDGERKEHEAAKAELEKAIAELEADLAEEERRNEAPAPDPAPAGDARAAAGPTRGKEEMTRMNRGNVFYRISAQERDALFARDDVRDFMERVRTCIREKRAIENVGLTIPEAMLPLLRQVVQETSKLIGRVNHVQVAGTARQRIMGSIPEAVWTEMCASLNELELGFNQTEIDGYKVGGFFAVCNAYLEDSDLNLASEIITALGKAIGKALDKAIVYGKGVKMPLGIVTRLAQTAKPSDYSSFDRAWADLHSSHIVKGSGANGIALFQEIVGNAGVVRNDYFENGLTWVMNQGTHTKLLMQSMDKNMNAAIVAGLSDAMPVVGGGIVELPFVPDDNIICGYLDAYLLGERAGTQIGQSEHYRFVEDQTVFRGTARFDGKPVIPEAFMAFTISNKAPATSVDFPSDTANTSTP